MKGLWSDHFPSASTPEPLPGTQRCFICPSCNSAVCRLLKSGTAENPDRKFYKCFCSDKSFKWADEVRSEELVDVPNCGGCSAGVCRVRREKSGPNAGRILFMCRVKEGEGSCGYRVWQDELEMSVKERSDERVILSQSSKTNCNGVGSANTDARVTSFKLATTNCNENGPTNTVVVEETRTGDEGVDNGSPVVEKTRTGDKWLGNGSPVVEETRTGDDGVDNGSPVIDTSQHCECLGVTSGKMEQLKYTEEKSDESSRRSPKRSRCGDLKAPGLLVSANSLTLRLPANPMSIDDWWVIAAYEQNLGTQLQGWWGRLAFNPMPCLTTRASTSFTCNVSSPLDSTLVGKDKIPVNSSNSTATTLTTTVLGAEGYTKPPFNPEDIAGPSGTKTLLFSLDVPSSSEPFHETRTHNVMSKSISKAFSQAAGILQNNLLTLLETMDVKDHEAMTWEAKSTFAALDHLLFDHQDFKKRIEEFIHHARSLAEIEQSMPANDSYQQLVDNYSSERTKLDKFNCLHAESVDDVRKNKKHLEDLQEEIRSTMDWIFQIEAELSSFEVEMRTMEQQLEVVEGQYLILSQELEESQKFYERKEAERTAAKAAFDQAKALLRG